jgi:gliding motility-associated-like protein
VTVTDDHGCTESASTFIDYNSYIDAAFTTNIYYGNVPFGVNFTFTGTPADSYFWNFGDGGLSTLQNPGYTYTSPGVYLVTLLINSGAPDYCTDTMSMYILANDISTLMVPDVFTPNNDGYNDYFEVQTYWILSYHLSIYNRWGRLMFESDDPSKQWDGRDHQGIQASCGTYFYVIEALGKDFKQYSRNGTVTLLR